MFEEAYLSEASARTKYRRFLDLRFGSSGEALTAARQAYNPTGGDPFYAEFRLFLWDSYDTGVIVHDAYELAPGVFEGLARAFVDVVDGLTHT